MTLRAPGLCLRLPSAVALGARAFSHGDFQLQGAISR
jgi:hypothetical protein